MKKIVFVLLCFLFLCCKVHATSSFYIGYNVDNLRYVKNKNGKLVYSNFKTIHKNGTDELAYCIQPGVMVSNEGYQEYEDYNENFKISKEQMEEVKLIAKYGYLYKNHTDINWYVATQYLIWDTVKPEGWDIYFVDENNSRINNIFSSEISEIKELIKNHHDSPNIDGFYEFNYMEEPIIYDDNRLLDFYNISSGIILNNHITLENNLEPGDYSYNLMLTNDKKPLFYNHPTGQDLFTKGEILKSNISFKVHITAGKVLVNECNEEDFQPIFIGGTYDILDQDDEVIDTITCSNDEECLSKILPIGYYKIRVKSLNDDFETNDQIYDVLVSDKEISSVSVCSLKKKPYNLIMNTENKTELSFNFDNKVDNKFMSNYYVDNNYSKTVNNVNVSNKIIQNYNEETILHYLNTFFEKNYSDNSLKIDNKNTNISSNCNQNTLITSQECVNNCNCDKFNMGEVKKISKDNNIGESTSTFGADKNNIKMVKISDTYKNNYLFLFLPITILVLYFISFVKKRKYEITC